MAINRKHGDEDQRRVVQPAAEVDQEAQALIGADELADHRADHRQRGADLQPAQQNGQRGRHFQLEKVCQRVARSERINSRRSCGTERTPDDRVHQDGEEDDQGGDQDLRESSRAEPDHQQRCDGDDRDGLRGDDVGGQQSLQGGGLGDRVAQERRSQDSQEQPGQDLAEVTRVWRAREASLQAADERPATAAGEGSRKDGTSCGHGQDLPDRQARPPPRPAAASAASGESEARGESRRPGFQAPVRCSCVQHNAPRSLPRGAARTA